MEKKTDAKKIVLISTVALVVLIVSGFIYGLVNWRSGTERLRARLRESQSVPAPALYDSSETDTLPAPVRRYLGRVLEHGQPIVAGARIRHEGDFNMSDEGVQWKEFSSNQMVTTDRPGFVWDARIEIGPLLIVFVHDAYIAGEGLLRARFVGILTVADEPSTPELAQGELMRYLAESVWYPTALLPSQGVEWTAVDSTSARATLRDGGNEAILLFVFGGDGLVESVRSEGRYREVDGKSELVPWEGRFEDYRKRGGMLIPLGGVVAWEMPGGRVPYWRARIEEIEYRFAGKEG